MYYPYFWQIFCQKMTHALTQSQWLIHSGIEENIRFCHLQVPRFIWLVFKLTALIYQRNCVLLSLYIQFKWNKIRRRRWLKPLILGDETFVTKPCASCQKELTIFRSNMKGGGRDTWCQLSKIQHTIYMISKYTFCRQLSLNQTYVFPTFVLKFFVCETN